MKRLEALIAMQEKRTLSDGPIWKKTGFTTQELTKKIRPFFEVFPFFPLLYCYLPVFDSPYEVY